MGANDSLLFVSIAVIVLGFAVMAIHPYQRGGFGHRSSRASGPVWFLIVIVGIGLLAYWAYLSR